MKENITEEEKLRKLARERVEFKRHLVVYIVIIGFLGLINLLTSRHFPWFLFPAGGWGIGLIFHFLAAYGRCQLPRYPPGRSVDSKKSHRPCAEMSALESVESGFQGLCHVCL